MPTITSRTDRAAGEAKAVAASVPAEADRARAKPAFQRFARVGLGSRAVIYLLLAFMAVDIALTHNSPAQPSGSGALSEIAKQPGGRALVAVLAFGFAGYGAWRLAQALTGRGQDERARGKEAESALKRSGFVAVAVIYFGLCARAVALAILPGASGGDGGGSSSNPQPFVGHVLGWPAGPLWVGLVGAAVAIGGAVMAIWGVAHSYAKVLDTSRMSPAAFQTARATGTAGEATRGLLVILVSVYLLSAAVTDNPAHAKSLGEALRSFDRLPPGPVLLVMAGVGLACFAVYSLFEALYRRL